MFNLDAVGRWIYNNTGRTIDQHAVDPLPAAADLPRAADHVRTARTKLMLAVDRLRTVLINEDDFAGPTTAVSDPLDEIESLAREYRYARNWTEALIDDPFRVAYAAEHLGSSAHRRYIKTGDALVIVLPHTEACRRHQIAGRRTRIKVDSTEAELEDRRLRLPFADAGIHRDTTDGRLYVLEVSGDLTANFGS